MASSLKWLRGLILAGSVLLLGACATTSQFSGFVSGSQEDLTTVRKGGWSETAVAQIAIVQNPDFNGGRISPKAVKKIQEYALSCQGQIDAQVAGALQSGVNGAVPYGAAGAVGTGEGAALAFSGASFTHYAIYGGVAYLFAGAVNGDVSGSYSAASAKGSCTAEFWKDIANTDPDFEGTHVVIVYSGKRWGGSVPPALNRSASVPPPLR